MKNIKKVSVFLLAFVIVFCFKNIGKACSVKDIGLRDNSILRWENNTYIYPELFFDGTKIVCNTNIEGDNKTTKIRAELTLEEKTPSGWISLAGWITTEYSSSLNVSYSYPRASSGKTYRLTVTADVTTNGRTETVSRSVTESF